MIKDGNIIPGKRIGVFALGMTTDDILSIILDDYSLEKRGNGIVVYHLQNANLFIKEGVLFQIGVSMGFQGRFDNKVMIGTSLHLLIEQYPDLYEEYDNYLIASTPGIAFELEEEDNNEYQEISRKILWMFVFKI